MIVPSASRLPLISKCLAAAVLPQVGHLGDEVEGIVGHQHMDDRVRLGVDGAVEILPRRCAENGIGEIDSEFLMRRCRSFAWSPPAGAISELSLALLSDGSAIRVEGGRGKYPELPEGAICVGQFDLFWSEPQPLELYPEGSSDAAHPVFCPEGSDLWVVDFKWGQDRYVEPVETNAQIQVYALMGARWTGATSVIPAVVYPSAGDGDWDVPAEPWGPDRLNEIERDLRNLKRNLRKEEKSWRERGEVQCTEGRHCTFCPARAHCPAKTALLKMAATPGMISASGDGLLDQHSAAYWAGQLRFLEDASRRIKEALRNHVEAIGYPIELGDGTVWGPTEISRDEIIPAVALPILEAELGEHAEEAKFSEITKEGIKRAAKAHMAGRRGVAPLMRSIIAKLGEAGAIVSKTQVQWGIYRPHDMGHEEET